MAPQKFNMENYKTDANEEFFEWVFHNLNEGGTYVWEAEDKMFTKLDGKFIAEDNTAYGLIKAIVGTVYFNKRFLLNGHTDISGE